MAATTLVGSALGLTGGYLLGAPPRPHLGRRRGAAHGAGCVGTLLVGFGAADVFDLDIDLHDRRVTGLAIAGSALGVRGRRPARAGARSFTVSQSILIDLAAIAGGAGRDRRRLPADLARRRRRPRGARPYLMAAAVGGAAGFALAYWALHDRPAGSRAAGGPRQARRVAAADRPAADSGQPRRLWPGPVRTLLIEWVLGGETGGTRIDRRRGCAGTTMHRAGL